MGSRFKSLVGVALALAGCTVAAAARAAETVEELSVETATPDALCPDLAATRQAVRDRIGQLSLDGGRWVARYTIGHAPGGGGDYVELVLKDGAGKVRLERRIPFSGESCDTVAQAIALVLERHFRELQQPSNADATSSDLAPDGAQTGTTAASSSPAPSPAAAHPAPSPATEAPVEPLTPSLELSAFGGYGSGRNTGAVGVGVGYWFARSIRGAVSAAVLLPQVKEEVRGPSGLDQGEARLFEVPLRVSLAWGLRRATWAVHVGPEVVVGIQRASTQGLRSPSAENGASLAAGGAVGVSYWLSPNWGLTALVAIDAKFAESGFAVRAGDTVRSVLISPSPQGWGLLGVTFGVTP